MTMNDDVERLRALSDHLKRETIRDLVFIGEDIEDVKRSATLSLGEGSSMDRAFAELVQFTLQSQKELTEQINRLKAKLDSIVKGIENVQ